MITAGYLAISLACLIVLFYAFKLWRQNPDSTTLLILIPVMFLWLDNFAIATGKFVGEGMLLKGMTYLRFYWHWQMLPLLVIAAGALARRAGYGWAQNKIVMAAFCVLAVFFMIEDVPYIWQVQFQPACYGDTYRFVINIPAGQLCEGATALAKQASPPPFAAIGVNVILMILGFMLWWRDKFPTLAICCLIMFVCAATSPIPGFYLGQLVGNVGEPIFYAGVLAAGFKYAGTPRVKAEPVPA